MTPTEELRLLTVVLKRIEGGPKTPPHVRWISIGNWLVLVAAFVALFRIGPRVGPIVYVVAGVGGFLGMLTCAVMVYERSLKQWPILSSFIKADEVKLRIEQLSPDKSLERTRGE